MRTGPGEPVVEQWKTVSLGEFADAVMSARPRVVAVDGRSGSGKSTLAGRLSAAVPGAVVVHGDDVAWHAPMFGWSELLAHGVLEPVRRGEAVAYRPPAWEERGRPGAIEVPADTSVVVVEGVGAGRRELAGLIDVLVWVQSDFDEAEKRGIDRDIASGVNGDAQASIDFWHEWLAAEIPFLERDRPWERADVVVAGTSPDPQDAATVRCAGPALRS
ncbi:uridine kinase family protein [Kribbella sp. CA-253562]|uniref:uridine kinase family protein n=1 Tax=Kribbella sp. CA-253562 TaxID=3239942 RepID=UPI003D93E918